MNVCFCLIYKHPYQRGLHCPVLAWCEQEAVGSAIYYYENEVVHIGRVSVIPSVRNSGIGQSMLAFIEETSRKNGLLRSRVGVRLSLPKNIDFYQKLGYEIKEEHAYAEKTDGWYVMMKEL